MCRSIRYSARYEPLLGLLSSGIKCSCLFGRVERSNDNERLFRASGDNAKHKVDVDGERYTLKDISNRTGIQLGTIYARYKSGWRGADLFKPLQVHRKAT